MYLYVEEHLAAHLHPQCDRRPQGPHPGCASTVSAIQQQTRQGQGTQQQQSHLLKFALAGLLLCGRFIQTHIEGLVQNYCNFLYKMR